VKEQSTFWFGVKRYGYGWGLPVRWQGWAALVAYFALLYLGTYYFKPRRDALGLFVYFVVLSAALVAIIVVKGERPLRWRWGKK
jgi:phosphoglycerol transferase MdoB-like AlkP superfamily enzyme